MIIATISSALALEDKMSSTLNSISDALDRTFTASERLPIIINGIAASQEEMQEAFKPQSLEQWREEMDKVEIVIKGLDDKQQILNDTVEESKTSIMNYSQVLEANRIAQEEFEEITKRGSEVVKEQADSYDELARINDIMAFAAIEASESFEKQTESLNKVPTAIDAQSRAFESASMQVELSGERLARYQEKLDQITESILRTNIALVELNDLQEESSSPLVQEKIDSLNNELMKLESQYQNVSISVRGAESAHVNAMNRIQVSSMKLNPLITGLNSGIKGLPPEFRQLGSVGVQALSGLTTGANLATVGFTLMNAALSMGISLAVSLLVKLGTEFMNAEDKGTDAFDNIDKSVRRASSGIIKTTGELKGKASEIWESYERNIENADKLVTQMQFNAFMTQKTWRELENLSGIGDKTNEQITRMETLINTLNNTLPGLNLQMSATQTILDEERKRVEELTESYKELARVKGMQAAYESKIQAAFESMIEIEDQLLQNEQTAAKLREQANAPIDPSKLGVYDRLRYVLGGTTIGSIIGGMPGFGGFDQPLAKPQLDALNDLATQNQQLNQSLVDLESSIDRWIDGMYTSEESAAGIEESMKGLGIDWEKFTSTWNKSWGDIMEGDTLKTTVKKDVSISDESLKMLHDISTMEYRPIYQTITPQMVLNDTIIRETADVDAIFDEFARGIEEASEARLDLVPVA